MEEIKDMEKTMKGEEKPTTDWNFLIATIG